MNFLSKSFILWLETITITKFSILLPFCYVYLLLYVWNVISDAQYWDATDQDPADIKPVNLYSEILSKPCTNVIVENTCLKFRFQLRRSFFSFLHFPRFSNIKCLWTAFICVRMGSFITYCALKMVAMAYFILFSGFVRSFFITAFKLVVTYYRMMCWQSANRDC